jgi:hypothetical protein
MPRTHPTPDPKRALPYDVDTWRSEPHTLRKLAGGFWLYIYEVADFDGLTPIDAPRPVRATLGFSTDPAATAPDYVGTVRNFRDLTAPECVKLARRYGWIAEAMEAATGDPVHPLDIPAGIDGFTGGRLSWSDMIAACPYPGIG